MTGCVLGPAEGLRGVRGRTWPGRAWNAASTYLHYMEELLFSYEGKPSVRSQEDLKKFELCGSIDTR